MRCVTFSGQIIFISYLKRCAGVLVLHYDQIVFIGPEFDHWLTLVSDSLPNSLTHSCSVDLTDVTLAFKDSNSKLVELRMLLLLMLMLS